MDATDLVAALAAAAPAAKFRIRQGLISSVQADGTVTVTIGAGTTPVPGIHVAASCCPIPGASCWIATDGRDMLVLATQTRVAELVLTRATSQAIADATWTAITWTAEVSDNTGMWTSGTTSTVVVPGLYQITAQAVWPSDTTGLRGLRLLANGTPLATDTRPPVAATHTAALTWLARLAVGDTLTAEVEQTTGGSVNLTSAALNSARIGP